MPEKQLAALTRRMAVAHAEVVQAVLHHCFLKAVLLLQAIAPSEMSLV